MTKANAMLRCQRKDEGCVGVIGAWVDGAFFPSAHLVAGRDLYVEPTGTLIVRCSLCGQRHQVWREPNKGRLVLTTANGA